MTCFYCNGGLWNWQPEDEPWIEHAANFPGCGFVRLNKGEEFVQKWAKTRSEDGEQQESRDQGQGHDECGIRDQSGKEADLENWI